MYDCYGRTKEQKEINKSAGWGPAQRRLDDWAKAEPTLKESHDAESRRKYHARHTNDKLTKAVVAVDISLDNRQGSTSTSSYLVVHPVWESS